ncbi:hypothetical protein [Ornithinimicrobium kibberense]|uniref:hypothetical protein n=1 Tax=Ornithinimicrobium kibberense TaxID=282060 RepID=UPI00361664EE
MGLPCVRSSASRCCGASAMRAGLSGPCSWVDWFYTVGRALERSCEDQMITTQLRSSWRTVSVLSRRGGWRRF